MSHKFKLGQRVRRAQIGYAASKADVSDVFEIVRLVPEDQTGEPFYRIKSGSSERAVREGEITEV
ncbi:MULTISPECIES: hypothetical protein [Methylobacterium]|jgi:hypothetical protein|uniref:DUF1653 domain-containing protein n=1 Tax=Methylobacterium goesingense TaxID=243690 RepID=A0ABV2L248_9HYPH|nr:MULTISPECIES: hypothetical protein [Methylobacterium]MBY0256472.1 hypothetical protein [Methylobacterium sp.]GJD72023.1 hypothetical protein CFIICLFH_0232 [Methylobacterium goesingense]